MPVIYQKMIYRKDCQSNPDYLYLMGDNEWREGKGGQAKEMRGEPNVIGIRTKAKPSQQPNSYWSDETLVTNCLMVYEDFIPVIEALVKGKTVVVPTDGLGTGLSDLQNKAPHTLRFVENMIAFCEKL